MQSPKRELDGYVPLEWVGESYLTPGEQEVVEAQRRDLWRHGIRKEPMLTRMAFELGYVVVAMQRAENAGKPPRRRAR